MCSCFDETRIGCGGCLLRVSESETLPCQNLEMIVFVSLNPPPWVRQSSPVPQTSHRFRHARYACSRRTIISST